MERKIHGPQWDTFHNGYFSSSEVVRCFIDAVRRAMAATDPEVVLDLGGGTGFLLARLRETENIPLPSLVNLDCSTAQLAMAAQRGITCLCGSVSDFRRSDLAPENRRFLFLMRSVLHYFGQRGLEPLLNHLRGQAREGELFVHQSACFETREEAECLNILYREMGTDKWYPTVDKLRRALDRAGWQTLSIQAAPPLPLTGADLARRYSLDGATLRRIRSEMAARRSDLSHLVRLEPDTFRIDLHYRILVCRAGS